MVTLVAHLTDLHFGGPADARARADRVLDHLLALDPAPDLLLVTGDVADHGHRRGVRRGARGPVPLDRSAAGRDRQPRRP